MAEKILVKLFPQDIVNNIIMWECYINIAERNKNGWSLIHKQLEEYNNLIIEINSKRGEYIRSLIKEIPDLQLIKKTINTMETLKSYSLW
tara:strand:+ start:235 stop:504 length:270 start_codon:yes stop_codon:yes gene_type:complete